MPTDLQTELRKAIAGYKAYLETGERCQHKGVDCIKFGGVTAVHRLSGLRLRLRAAIETAYYVGEYKDVADLLAESPLHPLDRPDDAAVVISTVTTTHNGITRLCVYVRLPVAVLDLLDRALARLPVILGAAGGGQGGEGVSTGQESGEPGVKRRAPLSLFISYSHKDERFRDELRGALTAYERTGELVAWDDTKIVPGQKWETEILENLERADIIVLLLSNDFIRSNYCMQKEMKSALARDAAGDCAIVPIVVRACAFTKLELGRIQAIQPGDKPIKQHNHRDAAWLEVTNQIEQVIARLNGR